MKNVFSSFCSLCIIIICSCSASEHPAENDKGINKERVEKKNDLWNFAGVDGSTIRFSGNRKFDTGLYDLNYLGKLSKKSGPPIIIVSGRECSDCDENISIYILSPDKYYKDNNFKFTYPGKVNDYLSGELIFESRVFFGQCQSDSIESIAWVQSEKDNYGKIDSSVFVLSLIGGQLKGRFVDNKNFLKTDNAICYEIPGIDVISEP